MAERDQYDRWRCTVVGCNPVMLSIEVMESHQAETGHRTAKWPIRSKAGKRKARKRNRTGYYDKYNVGEKSAAARGIGAASGYHRALIAKGAPLAEGEDGSDYWGDSTGGAM